MRDEVNIRLEQMMETTNTLERYGQGTAENKMDDDLTAALEVLLSGALLTQTTTSSKEAIS